MKSLFGKKLFHLLLIFSLVPTLALALLGFYLVSETTIITAPDRGDIYSRLVEAQRDAQYRRLLDIVRSWSWEDTTGATAVDFLFLADDSAIVFQREPSPVSSALATELIRAAKERPQGFFESGDVLLQYVCQPSGGNGTICAGYVLGPQVAEALQAAQGEPIPADSGPDIRERYVLFVGALMMIMVVMTLVAAYYLSRRISQNLARPLAELSAASVDIASGDFERRVTVSASGEMATLIMAFNRMAERLSHVTARLTQAERVGAWRHIARRFAHELKNPLQPITISLYRIEKLLTQAGNIEPVREPLAAIAEEIRQLTRLADRFSKLARLPEPNLESTDLVELLSSMAALYKEKLADFDFSLSLPRHPLQARIDPTYFREALHNLLQNAMDASMPGGQIVLKLRTIGDEIEIEVADRGHGMSTETTGSARLPYFTTKDHGTGLGLSVTEKVVTECGGRLDLKSESGQGTTVTIALPREGDN